MSRNAIVGSLTMLMLTVLLAVGPARFGMAQATPTADEAIVREALATGQSAITPDHTLLLQRRTFAPGSDSGAHPAPGPVVLSVMSGTLELTVPEGAATVTRASETETETENVAAGDTVTLNAGDAVFYDEGVVHQFRNPGTEPAVTMEARLTPKE